MEYKKSDNFPFNLKGLPHDKIWFTSDPHFMHENIIKYTNRPFDNADNMNEVLIKNWNKVVGEDELVFCLGDFALGKEQDCLDILKRLNGHKVLIKGNHEKTVMKKSYNRDEFDGGIYELLEIRVEDEEVANEFQDIVLCHYTMTTWNKSHRGSWQLFGHVHGMLDNNESLSPNQIDVGVDSHQFYPISYQQVKEIITQRNLARIKNA
jgi:calcineurin-like phosphoesterase family protein